MDRLTTTQGRHDVQALPDLKEAYCLSQNLRAIFNKRSTRDSARLNLARWYNRVAEAGFKSFNTIAATFYEHSDGNTQLLRQPLHQRISRIYEL